MTDKKKFDINTIDIDTSSQESKFHVDEDPSDVVDKFQTIGEDYAGTGLTGKNSNGADAQDFGAKAFKKSPAPLDALNSNKPKGGSEMMESMYGGNQFG